MSQKGKRYKEHRLSASGCSCEKLNCEEACVSGLDGTVGGRNVVQLAMLNSDCLAVGT